MSNSKSTHLHSDPAGIGRRLAFCAIGLAILSATASAQTYPSSWPAESAWQAYTKNGAAVQDAAAASDGSSGGTGINPNSADIFNGTNGNLPSAYFYYDTANQVLFFRLRLAGSPQQGSQNELQNGTWNAVLDTDGDGWKEYFIELNGSGADTISVYWGDTNRQSIVSADCSDGEGRVFTRSAVWGTHYRVTAAAGGGYFLDFQVPLNAFVNCAGVQILTTTTPFSIAYTTSATAQNPAQKDLLGAGDYTMADDRFLPTGDGMTLGGGTIQAPKITGVSHTCGAGVNSSPVTLTATTLDVLDISGGAVVDTIANVTFLYRPSSGGSYTQIAQVVSPVSGTINRWQTQWNTSALSAGTYFIRVTVTDDQGNTTTDDSLGIDLNTCATVLGPAAVELVSFTAVQHGKGVLLEWQTGYEVDNLGFHIYRDEDGTLTPVTEQMIAGSALLAGARTVLTGGLSYSWLDRSAASKQGVRYWLVDYDLNGETTWHGPVVVEASKSRGWGSKAEPAESALIEEVGRHESTVVDTAPVERRARIVAASEASLQLQSNVASQPAMKLMVKREGWYRVTQPELVAAGLSPKTNPQYLRLYVDGQEQPIVVTGEKDGSFDAEDVVEFYGVGLDTPYTEDRCYWLTVGSQPGRRISVTRGSASQPAAASFLYTVERRDKKVFFAALKNGDAENFFGPVVTRTPLDQTITLSNLDTSYGLEAGLEIALQGVTQAPHQVTVSINGSELGDVVFKGQELGANKFSIPQRLLQEGDNRVTLVALGGNSDVSLVAFIKITYWHTYQADNGALRFTASGGQLVTVQGFNSKDIRVVDVTNASAPQEVAAEVKSQDGGYSVTIAVLGKGSRTLMTVSSEAIKRVASIAPNQPSNWKQSGQAADLVIISHQNLLPAVQALKAHRESQGLAVAIVDVEDVYDEFSYGHKTPLSIKDFVSYARTNWRRAPRYLLLTGDATYDPKNYLARGDFDLVPTKMVTTYHMETSSDDWFADLNGDGLAEMAVGRLPVRTVEEARSVVDKIIGYDASYKTQANGALLVADRNDGFNFEVASGQLQSLLPADTSVQRVFRSGASDAEAKARIIDAINSGQRIVNYLGHGSAAIWRGNIMTTGDVRSLSNGDRLPLFVAMTCLNGYFQDVAADSLSETLLKAQRAGAVAVWASSGLTAPSGQFQMNDALFRYLFSGKAATIGEAMMSAKAATADGDVRRSWVLFGDPSTRLR